MAVEIDARPCRLSACAGSIQRTGICGGNSAVGPVIGIKGNIDGALLKRHHHEVPVRIMADGAIGPGLAPDGIGVYVGSNGMGTTAIYIAATVYHLWQGCGIVVVDIETCRRGNRRIAVAGIAIAVGLEGVGSLVIVTGGTSLGRMACLRHAPLVVIGLSMADLADAHAGLCIHKTGRDVGENYIGR